MLLRRLQSLLIALMLFAAGGHASAGTTYTFGGNASVDGCTLAGATYTCAALPLAQWDDSMVIASGYTVKITSNVSFQSTQHLAMSGSAVLSSTGNLDIGGISGNNLNITGGTLIAAKTFTVGSQSQALTADIQAGYAKLGSGSTLTINGNVTATGNVDIASHATINGAITGAAVTAASGVTLSGNIIGSKSFTLGSGNTVDGNITAPIVNLLPSQSYVTGNITATTSLELGSSVHVKGNVVTGTLTEDSSEAIIDGNATVDSAVLQWHGRVTQTIYCTGGTAAGKCDCVTNNSGYPVNTASGPHCQGKTVPLDHFMIAYDATASVCAPAKVTITACANAACTATYGGGASVTLAPTGQTVAMSSGAVDASVAYTQAGTNVLAISSPSTPAPTVCWRNGDAAPGADCQVNVAKSGYILTPSSTGFIAEDQSTQPPPTLVLAAVSYDAAKKACAPLFGSVSRDITFTCGYADTATPGILPVRLKGIPLNAAQNTGAACDGAGRKMSVTFDENGKVSLPVQYADAGNVTVTATDNGPNSPGSATTTATFVPAAFKLALATNNSYVAGYPFAATVTAVNALGATTRKFGTEVPAESAVLAAVGCQPSNNNGLLGQSATISNGVQTFALTWSEVGTIDLAATLANPNGYLSSGVRPVAGATNTASTSCTGAAGRFIPAYFTVTADTDWKRTVAGGTQLQYYSGEPAMKVTVTAYNKGNGVTYNYAGANARDVTFSAFDAAGTTPIGNGRFSRSATYPASDTTGTAQLRANDFVAGVGTWTGSYTFTKNPTAPTVVRVRATDADNASSASAAEPAFMLRSGRVHAANAYGNATGQLWIPVNIEFYTGQTWVRNFDDTTTTFAQSAVSLGRTPNAITVALKPFANGATTLVLTPAANSPRASVPFAINLGAPVAGPNTSCYYVAAAGTAPSSMTDSTGAGLPFLRSADASCGKTNIDPSALATFGIFAPETKRIIHMREVYR